MNSRYLACCDVAVLKDVGTAIVFAAHLPVLLLFLFSELIWICQRVASESVCLRLYQGGPLSSSCSLNGFKGHLSYLRHTVTV